MLLKPRLLGLFSLVSFLGLNNAFAGLVVPGDLENPNQKRELPRMLSVQETRLLNLLSVRMASQTFIDEKIVNTNSITRSIISELNSFLESNGPVSEGSIQWLINDCRKDLKQFRFWYNPCDHVVNELKSIAIRSRKVIMDAQLDAKSILNNIDTIIFKVKSSENVDISSTELAQYQVFANQIARLTEVPAYESDSRFGCADQNAERTVEFLNSVLSPKDSLDNILEKARVLKTSLERTLMIYRD